MLCGIEPSIPWISLNNFEHPFLHTYPFSFPSFNLPASPEPELAVPDWLTKRSASRKSILPLSGRIFCRWCHTLWHHPSTQAEVGYCAFVMKYSSRIFHIRTVSMPSRLSGCHKHSQLFANCGLGCDLGICPDIVPSDKSFVILLSWVPPLFWCPMTGVLQECRLFILLSWSIV